MQPMTPEDQLTVWVGGLFTKLIDADTDNNQKLEPDEWDAMFEPRTLASEARLGQVNPKLAMRRHAIDKIRKQGVRVEF